MGPVAAVGLVDPVLCVELTNTKCRPCTPQVPQSVVLEKLRLRIFNFVPVTFTYGSLSQSCVIRGAIPQRWAVVALIV